MIKIYYYNLIYINFKAKKKIFKFCKINFFLIFSKKLKFYNQIKL